MNRLEVKLNEKLIFGTSTNNTCDTPKKLIEVLEEIILMLKAPSIEDKEIF